MSRVVLTGKVTLDANTNSLEVVYTESFDNPPIINISSNTNTNIYLSNINNQSFIVNKNCEESVEIQYVIIEN